MVIARMSVVMPAHDESAIIALTLGRIIEGDPRGEIEIVVVANGCRDDTATVAASVSSRVRVVEIPTPSKIAALNAGDAEAIAFPRAYVDADCIVTAETLFALADELERPGGALVASPRFVVRTRGSNWFVRQYFKVWALSEYRTTGHIGSGVYALSGTGRTRFGAFPDVIADDRFVQQLFRPDERATLTDHQFSVQAPRTLSAQLGRATRIQVGNQQLAASADAHGLDTESSGSNHGALIARVARKPQLWPAFVVYCFAYLVPRRRAARMIARGEVTAWNRDETSRV